MSNKENKFMFNGHAIISLIPKGINKIEGYYILGLINKSVDYTVTKFKIGDVGEEMVLPYPISNKCNLTCDACELLDQYDNIFMCPCDLGQIDIYLYGKYKDNSKPDIWSEPITITPNCESPGQVICFDI